MWMGSKWFIMPLAKSQFEPNLGQNFFIRLAHLQTFALYIVISSCLESNSTQYILTKLHPFLWLSSMTKAVHTISWWARPIRRFLFEIEKNGNVVDNRKFWGFYQASGLRSSIHCFHIHLLISKANGNETFLGNWISNEIQMQARIWPTLTLSLECRFFLLNTAAQLTECFPTI